ncbi:type II toxin-antitoxin system PemK/MazF family toxin [Microbacterium phosphatis]|uniref:type II toxin-antitoxin system PemK/MazF family toxin n=1 Tax=Microbacterium phosphatis TaxID=3140248 RepID=UPI0031401C84
MARQGILGSIAKLVLGALDSAARTKRASDPAGAPHRPQPPARPSRGAPDGSARPGAPDAIVTVEVRPEDVHDLRLSYAPRRDGDPDAGEIVWTWVPYAENDGRGKDRPVLILARHGADRFYAVKLTSKPHDGEREYVSIGSGSWDSAGRESWVDLDQLYSVHTAGMRREADALDAERYARVAAVLQQRYGWAAGR